MSSYPKFYSSFYNTYNIENYLATESILVANQNNMYGEIDFAPSSLSENCDFYAATAGSASASVPVSSMAYPYQQGNNTVTCAFSAANNTPTTTGMTTFASIKAEIDDSNSIILLDALDFITPYYPTYSLFSSSEKQQASPCPSTSYSTVASNTPSSISFDFYYSQDMLEYFMTGTTASSPVSLLASSFTPAPSLSPELTNLALLPTIDNSNSNYCDFYSAMESESTEQLIKTEPVSSATADLFCGSDGYLFSATEAATCSSNDCSTTETSMEKKGMNLSLSSTQQEEKKKRPISKKKRHQSPESACSSVLSDKNSNNKKKMYPCNYCHRSFARSYDASRHTRVHTGNKPYVCPCCSKGFSRSDARVRHFRTEVACREGPQMLVLVSTTKSNGDHLTTRKQH